jgi:hypothetical protein
MEIISSRNSLVVQCNDGGVLEGAMDDLGRRQVQWVAKRADGSSWRFRRSYL